MTELKEKIECFRDPRNGQVQIGFASEVTFAPGGTIEITPDYPEPGQTTFNIHMGPAKNDRQYGIILSVKVGQ